MEPQTVTLAHILEAQTAIRSFARRTDLHPASASVFGRREVLVKAENLQRTGSFKVRGAYNRIRLLTNEEKKSGVICASAGNHAQGVALAAGKLGIQAAVVMPIGAPLSKIEATKAYGAEVILSGASFNESLEVALALQKERGSVFIHAFEDPYVIAGQGTVGLEILEDLPEVKTVAVPIGGGGLAAGVALAIKEQNPHIKVIGVEPVNAASMLKSFQNAEPIRLTQCHTIADGVAVSAPGTLTYSLCRKYLDGIITVTEDEIATAILSALERMKMVAEGAGIIALAALMNHAELLTPAVAVVSGGNIDVNALERIIDRALMSAGRRTRLKTAVPDRPGHLSKLLELLAQQGVNILSVSHDRLIGGLEIGQTAVEVEMETRNHEHVQNVINTLLAKGYSVS
ncbi:MAG: threonine ammonia-lyase [Oscillospiraceae bacterium]|jgi:threonine dehydratase|nr:threonine ammonia-lyase [Oscillospiraceae bacterium]